MIVTRENYEVWMLDYLEGKLSGKDLILFEEFLSEHPELREDPEQMESAKLVAEERFFHDSSRLKAKMLKQVIDEEELTCFESAEGILSGEKQARLEKRLGVSERLRLKLDQYREAKLMANFQVQFPDKENLKRSKPVAKERNMWFYIAAAAAFIGVVYLSLPADEQVSSVNRVPLSQLVKKPIEKKEETKPVQPKEAKQEPVVIPASSLPQNKNLPNVNTAGEVKAVPVKKTVKQADVLTPVPPINEGKDEKRDIRSVDEPALAQTVSDQKSSSVVLTTKTNSVVDKVSGRTNETKNLIAQVDDYKKLLSKAGRAGTNWLSRVSGNRLTISRDGDRGTSVNFESKLLGFQTDIK